MRKLILIPAVLAQIEFSESMYDLDGTDAGQEWSELYTSGAANSYL
jgi:hypothetical protein